MIKTRSKVRLLPKIKHPNLNSTTSETRKPVQIPQIMASMKYIRLHQTKEVQDSSDQKKSRYTHSNLLPPKKPRRSIESENKYQRSIKKDQDLQSCERTFEMHSTKNSSKISGTELKTHRSSKRQLLVPSSEIVTERIAYKESTSGARSQFHSKRSSHRQLLVPSSEVNSNKLFSLGASKSSSNSQLHRSKNRQLVLPFSEVNLDEISKKINSAEGF